MTGPETAPAGTGTTMLLGDHFTGTAGTDPNPTFEEPADEPKFDPEIVTSIPTGPWAGDKPLMEGLPDEAESTSNSGPVAARPFTVTAMVLECLYCSNSTASQEIH